MRQVWTLREPTSSKQGCPPPPHARVLRRVSDTAWHCLAINKRIQINSNKQTNNKLLVTPRKKNNPLDVLQQGLIMGSVFGKIGVEQPPYEVVSSTPFYEVRKFPRLLAIEAIDNTNKAFGQLASYIGVTGAAKNEDKKSIAMTAPVVSTEDKRMQFILPSSMQDAPKPLGSDVRVVERPPSTWAVTTWTGGWSKDAVEQHLRKLKAQATADGVQVDETQWEWHRFNPPWCLPRYRTNAVAIKVVG